MIDYNQELQSGFICDVPIIEHFQNYKFSKVMSKHSQQLIYFVQEQQIFKIFIQRGILHITITTTVSFL